MQPKKPREEKDFIYHVDSVMEQLQAACLQLMPDLPNETLRYLSRELFHREVDAESWEQGYRDAGHLDSKDLVVLGCIYCAHAAREYRAKRLDIAWTYLAEASYYAGAATYAKSLEKAWPEIMQMTAQQAVVNTKIKGGKAKNAGWQRVEDEAVRLVKLHGEHGKRWSTERQMAESIRSELWPVVLCEIPSPSKDGYVKTISKRLRSRRVDVGTYLIKKKEPSC